jgi:hypothetical protein
MPRRDALLRLYETLLARRAYQRKKLAGELANLLDFKAADSTGDSVDGAFETSSDEMSSQLAALGPLPHSPASCFSRDDNNLGGI